MTLHACSYREDNSNWKGESASTSAKHYRVRQLVANPDVCQICGAETVGLHLANLDHKYNDNDLDMWSYFCNKCHHAYDSGKISFRGSTITDRGNNAIKMGCKLGSHHRFPRSESYRQKLRERALQYWLGKKSSSR